jgi:hypothetical protein
MDIYQLLYVSGATRPMGEDDLDAILMASRRNNGEKNVTGVLLFAEDTFIQVLEGERSVVRELAAQIRKDRRHRNFMVLVERTAGSRAFADWQMGFKRLDPARASDGRVFRLSRRALESRMASDDGGLMLEAVLAFAGDHFLAPA